MYLEDPEEIIAHFLRANLSEITRQDCADRLSTATDSFTGDASEVEFVLDTTPDSITSITVDGITQIPYLHYNIDLDNKSIKFRDAPGNTLAIVVNSKIGSSWIYPDSPRLDLTKNSYPRIGSWVISDSSDFEELGDTADTYDTVVMQFDILAYKDQLCTVSSETIADIDVAKYLSRQVKNAFKDNLNSELIYMVSDFQIINSIPVPFTDALNIHRRIMEIRFQFRNLRRLTT